MKFLFLSLGLVALTGSLFADKPEPPAGFTALFNGEDLTGWYGWGTRDPLELKQMTVEQQADYKNKSLHGGVTDAKGQPAEDHIHAHWKVENGELVNDGKGLYLTTDKDYGDFELYVEYKALPLGDSGIYLRGIPQIQIWDPAEPDPKGLGRALGSGGLWNNAKGSPGKDPLKKMDKPLGEWNSFKIKMIGERVTIIFNGEVVVDNAVLDNFFAMKKQGYTAYKDPKAKAAQATAEPAKKANGWMLDPCYRTGPIQLQTHGSEIRWRHIYLREIGPEEALKTLAARDAEGYAELVNGKDLSNWQGATDSYEMKEGAIVCKEGKGGDLLSKEEFQNGKIRMEFKLPAAGNNGLALRTPLGGKSASDGLEIQMIDSDGYNAKQAVAGKPALEPYQYHGSLYHCVGAKHGFLNAVGSWNFQEVEVQGQRIKVTLNGTKILDVDIDSLDRSQIKNPPKGLDIQRGYIGLAGHNDAVEVRSFKVKHE
jgi:hypothetical protein